MSASGVLVLIEILSAGGLIVIAPLDDSFFAGTIHVTEEATR